MGRMLLASFAVTGMLAIAATAMLAIAGGAVGSEPTKKAKASSSKSTGAEPKKGGKLKAKTTTTPMKESGEKGGTEDINIGVGELQEGGKARPKLKNR
jgi:hypothetical protein